jgi:hypothetical protein
MAKTAEKPQQKELTSAEIIRELRGPLPEDDPEYQRFMASEGERERSPQEKKAVEQVRRELEALPEGTKLTNEQVLAFVERLPRRLDTWTSADVIRELRGPLPEDDPFFKNADHR